MSLKKLQMDADNPIFEEMTSDEQSEIASIFDTPQIDDKQNQQPISEIPLDNIRPSQHNRFEPYTGEKKQAMIDSIIENGIITPLTLRKTETSDISKNTVSSKAMTITHLSRTKIYPVRNL